MYLYLIFIALVLVAFQDVFHSSTLRSPAKKKLFWAFVCLFILISGFRWDTGTDWQSYYDHFKTFEEITFEGDMEPGYNFLNSLNTNIIPHYSFHLFVLAVLAIVPIAITIQRYSVYPFVSMLVWMTMNLGNIFPVRQTVAISLLAYSINFIIRKQKWKFVLTLAIAFTFHFSSIVFAFAYFLFNCHFSRKTIVVIMCSAIMVSLVSSSLITDVLYFVGGSFFQEKLETYIEMNSDNTFGQAFTPQQIIFRGLINRSIIILLSFCLLENLRKRDKLLNGLVNWYCVACVLFVLVVPISPTLGRLAVYYNSSQYFIIPYIFKAPFSRRSMSILFVLVLLYCCVRFRGVVNNFKDCYIPYKSVFSEGML